MKGQVHSEDSNSNMSDALLNRLSLEEKVSLLAAADWWRTPAIERDGVFIPHIKVCIIQPQISELDVSSSVTLARAEFI